MITIKIGNFAVDTETPGVFDAFMLTHFPLSGSASLSIFNSSHARITHNTTHATIDLFGNFVFSGGLPSSSSSVSGMTFNTNTGSMIMSVSGLSMRFDQVGSAALDQLISSLANAGLVVEGGTFGDTLGGDFGPDIINGNGGKDTLFGREGDDVLTGGKGNPIPKVDDAGFMNGALGADWTPVGVMDTTGDGRGDILWTKPGGLSAVWTVDGFQVGAGSGLVTNSLGAPSALGADWTASGFDDFNGDGKGDVLWSRASTGEAVIIQLDGTVITAAALLAGAIGANWIVKGTGDFDGDGKADILWRRDNGNGTASVAVWNMDGFTIKSASVNFGLTPNPINGLIGSDMQIAGVGDLTGDGRDDIFWRHDWSGGNAVWLINGPTSVTPINVGPQPSAYLVRGVGDLNGDGRDDLFWHTEAWLMNGNKSDLVVAVPAIGGEWKVVGLSDGTGDGIPDIYWTRGGEVLIWEMGASPDDVMTGGAGRDTFKFEDRTDTGNVITDFQAGAGGDMLGLSAVMAGIGMSGMNGLSAGVVRAVQNGTATEVQVDLRPGAGTHWVSFATLQNTTAANLTNDNWSF